MGHETGLPHAGAVGLRKPLNAEIETAPVGEDTGHLTDDQILAALEKNQLSEVRQLARTHTDLAIRTLAKICRSTKHAAAPRVTAARALLEWAHGKPAQQVGTRVPGSGDSKMKVIILKLSDGSTEELQEVDVTPGAPPIEEQLERSKVPGVQILEISE